MDPNTPPSPQTPQPMQPGAVPPPPAPMAPSPGPQMTPPPMSPQSPTPAPQVSFNSGGSSSSGSKKGLIAGVIAVVSLLLLTLVGGLLYIFIFSDAAQSLKASNGFMSAVTTKNIDKALTYIDNPGDDEKTFITQMADGLQGEYSLKDKTLQNDKGYFLYSISGAKNKYARTILDKESGSWKVNSLVSGENELRLIPGDTTETETSTSTSNTDTQASTLGCLVQDDYRWLSYDDQPSSVKYDATYNPDKNTFNKTDTIFFKPDSTEEDGTVWQYDKIAAFYKKTSDKQWKLRFEGSVYGTDSALASSKKLANDRAEAVIAELVSRGVPRNRMVIDPPKDYTNEPQTSAIVEIYRRVQVTVDPNCDGTTSGNR